MPVLQRREILNRNLTRSVRLDKDPPISPDKIVCWGGWFMHITLASEFTFLWKREVSIQRAKGKKLNWPSADWIKTNHAQAIHLQSEKLKEDSLRERGRLQSRVEEIVTKWEQDASFLVRHTHLVEGVDYVSPSTASLTTPGRTPAPKTQPTKAAFKMAWNEAFEKATKKE